MKSGILEKTKAVKNLLILFLLFHSSIITTNGQDTFSIVAVDPDTGEVGSAGASCVDGAAGIGGVQIISQLVPNRGGINGQAWICVNPHVNLELGITEMMNGASPDEIIAYLIENDGCSSQNFNPQKRQYGIVDFDEEGNARSAAFTGDESDDYKGHIIGPNYAIQGNILLGPEILEQMEAGFVNTSGSLADKLMAAMQGANVPGADSRCLSRGTSSTSGFLMVAQPDDEFLQPSLFLNILEMPFGEEPIDSLQTLYNEWNVSSTQTNFEDQEISIFPNPFKTKINIQLNSEKQYNKIEIYNGYGQKIKSIETSNAQNEIHSINLDELTIGAYLIKFWDAEDLLEIKKIIKM